MLRLLFFFYRLICMSCARRRAVLNCHRRRPLFELHLHPTLQFNGVTFRWDGFNFVRQKEGRTK